MSSKVSPQEAAPDGSLLRERTAAVWLPRDFLKVVGPDAFKFLQGQLSQDMNLVPGASAWSLLLAPQGKVVAMLRVFRLAAEEFVLDTEAGFAETVVDRLSRFKLRVNCDIAPLDWQCLAVRGADAHSVATPGDVGHVLAADWPGWPGVDLVGDSPTAPAGLELVALATYEAARIEAGIPVMGRELTESTIPAEAGVVDRSVSFTKGCYTGQELVARIDSRGGNVPRRLRGVVIEHGAEDASVPVGAVLEVDGAAVGTLTSVVWSPRLGAHVGLAYIKRALEPPADALLSWGEGTATARISLLPLVP